MGEKVLRRCCLVFLLAAAASAQTPAPPLTFEVASIKPAGPLNPVAIQSGKMHIGMKIDGAMVDIGSFSLKDLIRTAYEVKDYQISGPDWMNNLMGAERFNVQAKIPDGATKEQVPQMLQALLADRFKLVVHRETKDHSIYALIVAKGGPKLKEAEPEPAAPETPAEPKKGETVINQGSNTVRISGNMENGKGVTVSGGPQGQMRMSMANGMMHMEAARMSMAILAETITRFVDRPVVDMTDLKGDYQIILDLSMDDLKNVARAAGMGGAMGSPGDGAKSLADSASDPSGSSIFASIQHMGLKLDPRKGPVEVIIIDHYEKTPTEN